MAIKLKDLVKEDMDRVYFDPKMIRTIAKMTDVNDHNEARLMIAKVLGDQKFIDGFEKIIDQHKRIGDMPQNLIKQRDNLTNQMLKHVKARFINSKDVYKAL